MTPIVEHDRRTSLSTKGDFTMSKSKRNRVPASQKIQGNYKYIPENTLKSKEFQTLKPTELKIYICFLTYWIRNGKYGNTIKMSIDFIMEHTDLGRTTVWRSLKTLRQKEFIDYVTIRNITTGYTLNDKYTLGKIQ
jgi:hypothetical protein